MPGIEKTHPQWVFAVATGADELRADGGDKLVADEDLEDVTSARRRCGQRKVDDIDIEGRADDGRYLGAPPEPRDEYGSHAS